MTLQETKPITADELWAMGNIGRCELIYGELIMMSPAGAEHGAVIVRITSRLADFVEAHDLGTVFGAETGFKLASNLVRAPDVSFVRKERIQSRLPKAFFPGAPDIAVEVISPDDRRREVAEKVNTWLAHGTSSVWVADPSTMQIVVHRTGEHPKIFTENDTMTDEIGLPGFSLDVRRVFKQP
jgi:Uma2 family endonuclease